jgi:hypothetical protein
MTIWNHTLEKIDKVVGEIWLENLNHPPYSPDLAPSDFHLLRKIKQMANDVDVKETVTVG